MINYGGRRPNRKATVMETHLCVGDDYKVPCLCVRGEDHDEALFDVPVSPSGDDLADSEDWEDG